MFDKLDEAGITYEKSGKCAKVRLSNGRQTIYHGDRQAWVYRGHWEDGTISEFVEWFERSGLRAL